MVEKIKTNSDRLREGNISLILDSYDDLFSDFDPRPFAERALSDDFLVECKKASVVKKTKIELRLMVPKHKRNHFDEVKIKKRLKEHFHKHFKEEESKIRKIKAGGFFWFFLGVALMLFGGFPGIFLEKDILSKKNLLDKIIESYLFKDILAFNRVRNSRAIVELTSALAYQVGSEINENELSNRLKIDRKTVISYLDILEKSFVVRRLYPYSKNPRREIGRRYKVYFYDLGLRNALIGDFNPLNIRQDVGALWENFLFIERYKKINNHNISTRQYFWRSYTGAEVDYIEDPLLSAWEFKYSGTKISRGSRAFETAYKIKPKLINKENLHEFLF